MSTFRFQALRETFNRQPIEVELSEKRLSESFGENVFNEHAMLQLLHQLPGCHMADVL